MDQQVAAFAGHDADAPGGACEPGADAAFQKALCIENQVELALTQVFAESLDGPPQRAPLARLPQLAPFGTGPYQDLLEMRVVAQQRGRRGFGQPADLGTRVALSQSRDEAGGHDHIAEGGESDDEDAARGG